MSTRRVPPSTAAEGGWNILVSIGADNALSTLVPTLRATLRKVRARPGVTLCVQETVATKGSSEPPVTKQYVLRNGVPVRKQKLGSVDTGSAAALTTFLDWGISQAPTSKVALVLISHGTGVGPDGSDAADSARKKKRSRVPTSGIHYSDYFQSSLSVPCLAIGIEGSTKRKVDVVVFDACDMAELEMLYELQGVADFVVASEATVSTATPGPKPMPMPGIPYDAWVSALTANAPSVKLAKTAVSTFLAHQKQAGNSASIAALDPRAAPRVATAVSYVGTLLKARVGAAGMQAAIEAKRSDSLGFAQDYYRDLGELAANLRALRRKIPGIAAACTKVTKALEPVVVKVGAVRAGKDKRSGVSIVFQKAATPLIPTYAPLAFAKKAGKGWYKFLKAYARKPPAKKGPK